MCRIFLPGEVGLTGGQVQRRESVIAAIVIEIFGINRYRILLRSLEKRIAPQVPDDIVHIAVIIEIAWHNAVPPTFLIRNPSGA
ncbi:hypothetical protein D3C87_1935950 [compost metagenome]